MIGGKKSYKEREGAEGWKWWMWPPAAKAILKKAIQHKVLNAGNKLLWFANGMSVENRASGVRAGLLQEPNQNLIIISVAQTLF
jgi:hypothetical protein